MATGVGLDLVYRLIVVLVAHVLVVHVVHPVDIDQVEAGTRGGKVTPSDLPPGPDELCGADPRGPVEQRESVQAQEGEQVGEQTIPPPVEPYSARNE